CQSFRGGVDGVVALSEAEARQRRRAGRIEVERRRRNRRDAELAHEIAAKRDILCESKCGEVGQQKIAALAGQWGQSSADKRVAQALAALRVRTRQLREVT